jgi:hypothetical protein
MGSDARLSWQYPFEGEMVPEYSEQKPTDVTEELNRLLEIGRLLASVLTPEEIQSLRILLEQIEEGKEPLPLSRKVEIGNTSVT